MEPIFCIAQLKMKYREKKRKLTMVFIDLEKMNGRVIPRDFETGINEEKATKGICQCDLSTRLKRLYRKVEDFTVRVKVRKDGKQKKKKWKSNKVI